MRIYRVKSDFDPNQDCGAFLDLNQRNFEGQSRQNINYFWNYSHNFCLFGTNILGQTGI